MNQKKIKINNAQIIIRPGIQVTIEENQENQEYENLNGNINEKSWNCSRCI